jgi:hypothetical protein
VVVEPQSLGQVVLLSPASQKPSPQLDVVVLPQSDGHDDCVSLASQMPSPQVGFVVVVVESVQSAGQVALVSLPLHTPSPHTGGGGHTPQSALHESQLSVASQTLSPHASGSLSIFSSNVPVAPFALSIEIAIDWWFRSETVVVVLGSAHASSSPLQSPASTETTTGNAPAALIV